MLVTPAGTVNVCASPVGAHITVNTSPLTVAAGHGVTVARAEPANATAHNPNTTAVAQTNPSHRRHNNSSVLTIPLLKSGPRHPGKSTGPAATQRAVGSEMAPKQPGPSTITLHPKKRSVNNRNESLSG